MKIGQFIDRVIELSEGKSYELRDFDCDMRRLVLHFITRSAKASDPNARHCSHAEPTHMIRDANFPIADEIMKRIENEFSALVPA